MNAHFVTSNSIFDKHKLARSSPPSQGKPNPPSEFGMIKLPAKSFGYLNGIALISFFRAFCRRQLPSLPEVYSKPGAHFFSAPDLGRSPDVGKGIARNHRIPLHGHPDH